MRATVTQLICLVFGLAMYFYGKDGGPLLAAYLVISALKDGEK